MCDDMGFFVGSMVLFTYFECMSLFLIHTLSHGLIRAMDFMNLAKFHSKLALGFHSKAYSHPAVTESRLNPFLCGYSSTFHTLSHGLIMSNLWCTASAQVNMNNGAKLFLQRGDPRDHKSYIRGQI